MIGGVEINGWVCVLVFLVIGGVVKVVQHMYNPGSVAQEQLDDLQKDFEELNEEVGELQQEHDKVEREVERHKTSIADLENRMRDAEKDIDNMPENTVRDGHG